MYIRACVGVYVFLHILLVLVLDAVCQAQCAEGVCVLQIRVGGVHLDANSNHSNTPTPVPDTGYTVANGTSLYTCGPDGVLVEPTLICIPSMLCLGVVGG